MKNQKVQKLTTLNSDIDTVTLHRKDSIRDDDLIYNVNTSNEKHEAVIPKLLLGVGAENGYGKRHRHSYSHG